MGLPARELLGCTLKPRWCVGPVMMEKLLELGPVSPPVALSPTVEFPAVARNTALKVATPPLPVAVDPSRPAANCQRYLIAVVPWRQVAVLVENQRGHGRADGRAGDGTAWLHAKAQPGWGGRTHGETAGTGPGQPARGALPKRVC